MTEQIELLCASPYCAVSAVSGRVPTRPGYYAIYVNDTSVFPSPFREDLARRATQLIYIGIATVSLHERLVEQDLRHGLPSTFFRGIGPILGFRPQSGSLNGMSNQNNYKFSASDTAEIIRWMAANLSVSWVEESPALASTEKALIRAHQPLINTTHNPARSRELAALRLECRSIARTR